jgi:hypothetical protein
VDVWFAQDAAPEKYEKLQDLSTQVQSPLSLSQNFDQCGLGIMPHGSVSSLNWHHDLLLVPNTSCRFAHGCLGLQLVV